MKKSFVFLLITVLLFSSCSKVISTENPDDAVHTEDFTEEPEEIIPKTDIIIGTTGMTGSFSPLHSMSAGDIDVMSVINTPLVTLDRRGEVVRNAAVGEWRAFGSGEYYYEGIADTAISISEDNNTILTFRLREDVFFSDGVNMTADDIISTLYALCDTNYRGRYGAVGLLPIDGLENYKTNAASDIYEKYAEIVASGEFSAEQAELYYECQRQAWLAHIRAVMDYCVQNYADSAYIIADGDIHRDEWLQVALAMMVWKIADFPELSAGEYGSFTSVSGRQWNLTTQFPSLIDLYNEFYALYDGDLEAYINAEQIGQPWLDNVTRRAELLFIREMAALEEENSGADSISGIRRLNNYTVEVSLTGNNPSAVYAFTFPVVPRHSNNTPLGAGPYKLIAYYNGVAALEANEFYYKGAPEASEISFVEMNPDDLIYNAALGEADIIAVTATGETLGEIYAYSTAGLEAQEFDYGAFGYIGFNAERISIDEEPLSEESVNLRKGIAVIMAAYRDISVWNYYEGSAKVSEYPLSSVSWAAPRRGDNAFRTAFGINVNGEEIFEPDMNKARRLEAAKRAALGYFEAAGCTLNAAGNAIIELPEGMSGNYEVYIVGYGAGRHPSFLLLTMAADALRSVGINIDIIDVSSSAELYEAVFGGTADMWCAAWQGEVSPNTSKAFSSLGAENFFGLSDEAIDQRIDLANTSLNLEFYRNALELVLESAVCVPVYQRQRYYIFSGALEQSTIEADLTAHYSWAEIIWKIKIGG
ncbi:MAG: ABC transporter substrate-binding protein [Oscillospiraceae bacterium]|nr:ABC transporter substrate-binding protein [Oscillospiraceae bacterium]